MRLLGSGAEQINNVILLAWIKMLTEMAAKKGQGPSQSIATPADAVGGPSLIGWPGMLKARKEFNQKLGAIVDPGR